MKDRGFEVISGYKDAQIVLPKRKTKSSAGYDIAAVARVELAPGKVTLIPTGLKAYMQQNEYLGVHIRSGFALKNLVSLINGQGVIDADYYNNSENEGHIMLAVINHGMESVVVEPGVRVAQGIFYQYLTTDDDDVSAVRGGGFGSTGV